MVARMTQLATLGASHNECSPQEQQAATSSPHYYPHPQCTYSIFISLPLPHVPTLHWFSCVDSCTRARHAPFCRDISQGSFERILVDVVGTLSLLPVKGNLNVKTFKYSRFEPYQIVLSPCTPVQELLALLWSACSSVPALPTRPLRVHNSGCLSSPFFLVGAYCSSCF